jgi:uncharacterized alpha/beta hydrolase family protein
MEMTSMLKIWQKYHSVISHQWLSLMRSRLRTIGFLLVLLTVFYVIISCVLIFSLARSGFMIPKTGISVMDLVQSQTDDSESIATLLVIGLKGSSTSSRMIDLQSQTGQCWQTSALYVNSLAKRDPQN